MTNFDKALMEAHFDQPVEITLTSGETRLIRPIILVDEPPTPDLFFLPLAPDGTPLTTAGESLLLDEITAVRLPSPPDFY